MEQLQRILLGAFVLFAGATAVLQLRYGMLCGRAETADKQDDPKAKACQKHAGWCAILAGASLILCAVLGAINLYR